ncbi:MAG: SDR family NAD(P)-dependent oxidoreductase [Myxococcales bacterium]|nr:SDR family NAD(P)-dependent oxidoreductase [Myxococcales bacterium]
MSEWSERYGPWAVVTGAAQGVGLAYAEELLERGLCVLLVDRNPAVVEVAAGLGGATRSLVADLASPDWLAAVETAVADVEVGLAVANAGVSFVGRFLDMPAATRDAILRVNCDATVRMAEWALPPMVERGRGGFIVTSSGSALAGTAGVALYSASKAFVLNLAEAIGWELRDTGVVTQAVVAPSMSTPAFEASGVDPERMVAPAVAPRDVVRRALDALGEGTCWLADPGLELMAGLDRRKGVDLISAATTGMYPSVFEDD